MSPPTNRTVARCRLNLLGTFGATSPKKRPRIVTVPPLRAPVLKFSVATQDRDRAARKSAGVEAQRRAGYTVTHNDERHAKIESRGYLKLPPGRDDISQRVKCILNGGSVRIECERVRTTRDAAESNVNCIGACGRRAKHAPGLGRRRDTVLVIEQPLYPPRTISRASVCKIGRQPTHAQCKSIDECI